MGVIYLFRWCLYATNFDQIWCFVTVECFEYSPFTFRCTRVESWGPKYTHFVNLFNYYTIEELTFMIQEADPILYFLSLLKKIRFLKSRWIESVDSEGSFTTEVLKDCDRDLTKNFCITQKLGKSLTHKLSEDELKCENCPGDIIFLFQNNKFKWIWFRLSILKLHQNYLYFEKWTHGALVQKLWCQKGFLLNFN